MGSERLQVRRSFTFSRTFGPGGTEPASHVLPRACITVVHCLGGGYSAGKQAELGLSL